MSEKPFAVFLDRDGTVCEEVGYINHVSRCRVFPFSAPAIRALNEFGAKVVIISNQSGVARGYFPETLVQEVNEKIVHELQAAGAQVDGVYYCPHHRSVGKAPYRRECDCRKPRPGMLQRAAKELGVDLARSYVIGDRQTDIETAARNGLRSALVLTGYGLGEWEYHRHEWPSPPNWVCENLLEAVEKVLADARVRKD